LGKKAWAGEAGSLRIPVFWNADAAHVWPTQVAWATSRQRARMSSNCSGAREPASSKAAFSRQRPGFEVPTIAV
jgi:hypothetical protein